MLRRITGGRDVIVQASIPPWNVPGAKTGSSGRQDCNGVLYSGMNAAILPQASLLPAQWGGLRSHSAVRGLLESLHSLVPAGVTLALAWRDAQGGSDVEALGPTEAPARAAALVSWKDTFSRRAGRAGQLGRQYTPVVRTAYTNWPSAALSRRHTASQRAASLA